MTAHPWLAQISFVLVTRLPARSEIASPITTSVVLAAESTVTAWMGGGGRPGAPSSSALQLGERPALQASPNAGTTVRAQIQRPTLDGRAATR